MAIYIADQARNQGSPWLVKLAFVGRNASNKSGRSEKFWQASGVGQGPVEIRWGKIGSAGQSAMKDWDYAYRKANEKLSEGYNFVLGTSFDSSSIHKGFGFAEDGPFNNIRVLARDLASKNVVAFDKEGKRLLTLTPEAATEAAHHLGLTIQ
jgi:hypothetical protein